MVFGMPNRTEGRLVNIKVHYLTLGLHHVEEVRTEVPVVGKRAVFPVCEKRYSCAAYLWQHLRYVHKPNAGYIQYTHCPLCCKGVSKQCRLNAHIKVKKFTKITTLSATCEILAAFFLLYLFFYLFFKYLVLSFVLIFSLFFF